MTTESTKRAEIAAMFPAETASPEETAELGRRLMSWLHSGDVVALMGELGSGKTQFVKGACSEHGLSEDTVTSPTFTILQEYQGEGPPVYHFDAYRVGHLNEFYELGYEEYFFGVGICFVEWPKKVAPLIPDEALIIQFEHRGEDRRRIRLMSPVAGEEHEQK